MKRGSVVDVDIPPTPSPLQHKQGQGQGSAGSEQYGKRPAVIVMDDTFAPKGTTPTVVIVPLTSQLKAESFPGAVLIEPTKANGLSCDSVALCHQVRAIDRKRIDPSFRGLLSPADMEKISQSLKALLGLSQHK